VLGIVTNQSEQCGCECNGYGAGRGGRYAIGYPTGTWVGPEGQGGWRSPGGGGGVSPRLVDLRVSGYRISGLKGLSAAGAKIFRRRRRRENFEVSTRCFEHSLL